MASGERANLPAVGGLVMVNIFLAVVQTNIASLNLPISLEFHQTLYGLGILSSAFFAAYTLFELPGGMLAFRVGAKKLLVAGGLIGSVAALAGALSPSFGVLIAMRFLVGVGLGLSFPPIVVLLIRNLRGGSSGIGAGLVAGSWSVGGGSGIFAWAILSVVLGWRPSLFLGGALALCSTLIVMRLLPGDAPLTSPVRMVSELRRVLLDREVMLISVAFLGAGGATAIIGGFMVYFLEQHLGLSPDSAGLIGGLTYLLPIFFSPFFGRLYDRGHSAKRILLFGAALLAIGVGVAALGSVLSSVASVLITGSATGIFYAIGFSAARDRSPTREMESFTVGLADSFSLLGSFASPLYFSAIVLDYGYPYAWLAGGVVVGVTAAPLILLRGGRPT